jgi:hypothetical protein
MPPDATVFPSHNGKNTIYYFKPQGTTTWDAFWLYADVPFRTGETARHVPMAAHEYNGLLGLPAGTLGTGEYGGLLLGMRTFATINGGLCSMYPFVLDLTIGAATPANRTAWQKLKEIPFVVKTTLYFPDPLKANKAANAMITQIHTYSQFKLFKAFMREMMVEMELMSAALDSIEVRALSERRYVITCTDLHSHFAWACAGPGASPRTTASTARQRARTRRGACRSRSAFRWSVIVCLLWRLLP